MSSVVQHHLVTDFRALIAWGEKTFPRSLCACFCFVTAQHSLPVGHKKCATIVMGILDNPSGSAGTASCVWTINLHPEGRGSLCRGGGSRVK